MAHFSPLPLGQLYRSEGPGQDLAMNASDTPRRNTTQSQNANPNPSNRSILSTISSRLAGMRESERETEHVLQENRVQGRRERLLQDLNRLRDVAIGRMPFHNGDGMAPGVGADLEAQIGVVNGATGGDSSSRRGASSTGKTRREKEEGAALFGPNLANYFGSGSSSSGAVASTMGVDLNLSAVNPGSQKKSRLGSRGRARGASLSGLHPDDLLNSTPTLSDQGTQAGMGETKVEPQVEAMTMAEGIEIDTIKRWIDRSIVGGALEIPGAATTPSSSADGGNSLALCSTLQSYVNLKRNTVKLNMFSEEEGPEALSSLSVNEKRTSLVRESTLTSSSWAQRVPASTHLLQFEYDCASPNAIIQVFARASRKHGSWATWAATRESAGLSVDSNLEVGEEGENRFHAQRGPPPHVLGWPIFASRLKRGFGKPLKAAIALHLDLYAPPKVDQGGKKVDEGAEAFREPETPGLDAAKMLGDDIPATPAATTIPVQDPMARFHEPSPLVETKEARAAREKAERETLKLTIVVEALDEDGKPLSEPNLQTTYLRVASLPLRVDTQNQTFVDASNVIVEGQVSGHVQDIAMPVEEEVKEVLTSTPHNEQSVVTMMKRIWTLQVEGQEAEIGPHRFQLQELYGLSSRPPPPDQEEHPDRDATEATENDGDIPATAVIDLSQMQDNNATECLICLSSPPTTLLLPCTHGLCLECAIQLRESVKAVRQTERRRGRRPKRKYACPVCRRAYTNMLYLSTADEKKVAQAAALER